MEEHKTVVHLELSRKTATLLYAVTRRALELAPTPEGDAESGEKRTDRFEVFESLGLAHSVRRAFVDRRTHDADLRFTESDFDDLTLHLGTTLSDALDLTGEIERLAADYPHLTPAFRSDPERWYCDLQTMTSFFGLWGIETGAGKTKTAALVDARRRLEEKHVKEKLAQALHDSERARKAAELTAAESEKDDILFSAI